MSCVLLCYFWFEMLIVFIDSNTYPDALALFGAGRLPGVEKLVTTRFPLSKSPEAFEALAAGKDSEVSRRKCFRNRPLR